MTDQVPAEQATDAEATVAEPKRHPWSRAEVRFGALVVVLILGALAISQFMNAGHPAKGAPFGGVMTAPVVVDPNAPRAPHS